MPDPMILVEERKLVLEAPAMPEMEITKAAKRVADRLDGFDRQWQRAKFELGWLLDGLNDAEGARSLTGTAACCFQEARRLALEAEDLFSRQHFGAASGKLVECRSYLQRLNEERQRKSTS